MPAVDSEEGPEGGDDAEGLPAEKLPREAALPPGGEEREDAGKERALAGLLSVLPLLLLLLLLPLPMTLLVPVLLLPPIPPPANADFLNAWIVSSSRLEHPLNSMSSPLSRKVCPIALSPPIRSERRSGQE